LPKKKELLVYINAFLKPFFEDINPEEAASAVNELPYETKKIIMTRGIVYTLPNKL